MSRFMNVEINFANLNPNKPSTRNDTPGNKGCWDITVITRSKEQKAEWEKEKLRVTLKEDAEGIYYKANMKRNVQKADGTASEFPNIVDGNLLKFDGSKIGSGTIANIRTFPNDWTKIDKETGKSISGTSHVLMGLQIVKYVPYKSKPREDDFGVIGDTEVVAPLDEGEDGEGFERVPPVTF